MNAPAQEPPLRVHALVDQLGPGGAEFLLADFAAAAADAGIEFSVASLKPLTPPAPGAERLRRVGVEPLAVPVRKTIHPRELQRVRRHLAGVRPDLVHTHLSTSDFLGGIAARTLAIPSVSTIHADWWPRGLADRARTAFASRARRHCAAVVIAVSESARKTYLAEGRDRPGHVIVVRNGIVDRSRPGSGPALRAELGLGPDALVISAISRLGPEKNFGTAIEAVGALSHRFPQLRLVIAGDGPEREALERQAAPLGGRVVIAGHREDAMCLLDASDVVIHPSHFDALPTTLLEAMSASVPVVATAVGGMLEIIENGASGVLVAPPPSPQRFAAALEPLLADPGLRARLGKAARERYEREFGAAPWLGRMRAVYDRVLAGRGVAG